ncbi:hypothetical protein [Brachybacterium sp. YJGR34]|uniref:hypothetical protein n=1 Tax=Brachybacterium sp. YJGR34 TaxID=2059911 RepID=UPI000E0A821F|nr:hypothetical protein [Brachybacterium sp. YJGR34]
MEQMMGFFGVGAWEVVVLLGMLAVCAAVVCLIVWAVRRLAPGRGRARRSAQEVPHHRGEQAR